MSFWPFVRSPFTDLTATLVNHQEGSRCADLEMKVMDCLDAYGFYRGKEKCSDIIQDFRECASMTKQLKRFYAMRYERNRQYWAGERKSDNLYAEAPKPDSY